MTTDDEEESSFKSVNNFFLNMVDDNFLIQHPALYKRLAMVHNFFIVVHAIY